MRVYILQKSYGTLSNIFLKQGIVLNSLIKLLISAEARVSMASSNELLGILEVDLSALTLPVGTKWAPDIWACSMTDTKMR